MLQYLALSLVFAATLSAANVCSPGHPSGLGELKSCCTNHGPCPENIGDCSSDSDCQGEMMCFRNVGQAYGYNNQVDVCVNKDINTDHACSRTGFLHGPGETGGCCTPDNQCPHGVGDCNTDADCQGELMCFQNVGQAYGYVKRSVDVCVNKKINTDHACSRTESPNGPGEKGGCCTPDNKCPLGVGDCNTDADCEGNLRCAQNVGNHYGYFQRKVDVCVDDTLEFVTMVSIDVDEDNKGSVCSAFATALGGTVSYCEFGNGGPSTSRRVLEATEFWPLTVDIEINSPKHAESAKTYLNTANFMSSVDLPSGTSSSGVTDCAVKDYRNELVTERGHIGLDCHKSNPEGEDSTEADDVEACETLCLDDPDCAYIQFGSGQCWIFTYPLQCTEFTIDDEYNVRVFPCHQTDCHGVLHGSSVRDVCGVCGGDGSSCVDCAGVSNGPAFEDACGECGGDGSTCQSDSSDQSCAAESDLNTVTIYMDDAAHWVDPPSVWDAEAMDACAADEPPEECYGFLTRTGGCHSWKNTEDDSEENDAMDALACQNSCRDDATCVYFQTSADEECWHFTYPMQCTGWEPNLDYQIGYFKCRARDEPTAQPTISPTDAPTWLRDICTDDNAWKEGNWCRCYPGLLASPVPRKPQQDRQRFHTGVFQPELAAEKHYNTCVEPKCPKCTYSFYRSNGKRGCNSCITGGVWDNTCAEDKFRTIVLWEGPRRNFVCRGIDDTCKQSVTDWCLDWWARRNIESEVGIEVSVASQSMQESQLADVKEDLTFSMVEPMAASSESFVRSGFALIGFASTIFFAANFIRGRFVGKTYTTILEEAEV